MKLERRNKPENRFSGSHDPGESRIQSCEPIDDKVRDDVVRKLQGHGDANQ